MKPFQHGFTYEAQHLGEAQESLFDTMLPANLIHVVFAGGGAAPRTSRSDMMNGDHKAGNGESIPKALSQFDKLPDSAYVRLPVVAALYSIGPATAWRWSKNGRLPAPYKLGENVTAWNVGELRRVGA